ncbi:hypothetical protein CMI46_00150 [Candidatus Pacearchaeota archaeon]|nr:hypothetical protein [Candidatus Pacearchaeota archaeon]|tara:strand:+ start:324 stop:1028 length:705 start_codon:yes stop_codon:yes gene_type:complete
MKREVLLLVLVGLFIFTAGVLAQEVGEVSLKEEFVEEFVEDTNFVDSGEVNSVAQINQSELPEDIQIQDIEENSIGIFEVNFTESDTQEEKKVFVVTYATNDFKKKAVAITKNVQNLFFGMAESQVISAYLETANGVQTGEDSGYVMMRDGSVTGISTTLEVSGKGKLFISVYKNGEDTGFHNLISTDGDGEIDFDLQSEDVVKYRPGDVISVYVRQSGEVSWNNVVTMVETTS